METKQPGDWPEWMRIETLARYLDTTPKALTRRMERGTFLRPKKMGRVNRWRRSDVDHWLKSEEAA
jgi:predicted DNA-binding transcriptional regulator AlpA